MATTRDHLLQAGLSLLRAEPLSPCRRTPSFRTLAEHGISSTSTLHRLWSNRAEFEGHVLRTALPDERLSLARHLSEASVPGLVAQIGADQLSTQLAQVAYDIVAEAPEFLAYAEATLHTDLPGVREVVAERWATSAVRYRDLARVLEAAVDEYEVGQWVNPPTVISSVALVQGAAIEGRVRRNSGEAHGEGIGALMSELAQHVAEHVAPVAGPCPFEPLLVIPSPTMTVSQAVSVDAALSLRSSVSDLAALDHLTVDRVAETAHAAPSALYHWWDDISAYREAVVGAALDGAVEEMRDPARPPLDRARAGFRHNRAWQLVVATMRSPSPTVAERSATYLESLRDGLTALTDSEDTAQGLLWQLGGLELVWQFAPHVLADDHGTSISAADRISTPLLRDELS